jgi:hypothetical protein
MTASNWFHHLCLATAASCAVVLTSCNSSTDNPGKAPRVSAIPGQASMGGVTFNLDLTEWVTDPDGQDITYTVNTGGGIVAAGVYSHVFDTVGAKTVTLSAANGARSVDFSFDVVIETAQQAVIQAGSGLMLLDRSSVHTATPWQQGQFYSPHFLTISNSQGYTDNFKASLHRGHVVYERSHGSQLDLYVFDPFDPKTVRLGDDPNMVTDEMFEAKTSDNRVVFTSGTATDTNLYIFNAVTGLTRTISTTIDSHERNAMVDVNDMIYFESGPVAQRDIYMYDPSLDETTALSLSDRNEIILDVVTGGGVVFTRDEGAGDVDLWFYKTGVGLTQVGSDVASSIFQDGSLTYNGSTSDGMIVFTETVSATDTNIYYWDSTTRTTTPFAVNVDVLEVYHAVTSNAKIIYTHQVSNTDWNVHAKTVGGLDVDLSDSTAMDVFQAVTALNDVVLFRDDNAMHVYDDSAVGLLGADTGGSNALTFVAVLPSGNVVYSKNGSGLHRWDVSNASQLVSVTGTFAGAMENGTDFVTAVHNAGQNDIYIWRESSDALQTVSVDAADENFVVSTTARNGLVFSRQGLNTNYDLYVWDLAKGERRLTNDGYTHVLVGTYFLDTRW